MTILFREPFSKVDVLKIKMYKESRYRPPMIWSTLSLGRALSQSGGKTFHRIKKLATYFQKNITSRFRRLNSKDYSETYLRLPL